MKLKKLTGILCLSMAILLLAACGSRSGGGKSGGDSSTGGESNDTSGKYIAEIAKLASVDGYKTTEEGGDTLVTASVECPDYKKHFEAAFEALELKGGESESEIDKKFFKLVEESLEDDDRLITVEVTVNLTEADVEKTAAGEWTNEEIHELLKLQAVTEEFMSFCMEKVMEAAPEISENEYEGTVIT